MSKTCPICDQAAKPEYKPFCSKRCADVDLHRWLGGHYALPGEPAEGVSEGQNTVPEE